MDHQRMDQQVEQILQQARRRRTVEQASVLLQSMAQMEELIYGELDRYWRQFGRRPDDLAAWQARRKQRRRVA